MPSSGRPERFYSGDLTGEVTVRQGEERRLLNRHLPPSEPDGAGFTWGHNKSQRAELALALHIDALADDALAGQLRHDFDRRVVSILPDRWTMSRSRILAYVNILSTRTRAAAMEERSSSDLNAPTSGSRN